MATNLLVFGRGRAASDIGFELTRASGARVEALLDYIGQHAATFCHHRGTVVFSGGWAGAAQDECAPPKAFREGSLMLNQAAAAVIDGRDFLEYVEAFAEIESDSTLENVLRTQESGYFEGISFTPENPLGIIAHDRHLTRIGYLVRKIFGLPADAILTIAAPGEDEFGWHSEKTLNILTRLAFLGVSRHSQLRCRHQVMTAVSHKMHLDRKPAVFIPS